MPSIYNYLDYRRFLGDFYQEEKLRNKKFSLRYFALKAGYPQSTSSYFVSVVRGRRNLSDEYILKFCKGLGLKARESDYFEHLVRFNQARRIEVKNRHFEKLLSFTSSKKQVVSQDQYEFFSKWYHLAIWGILGFFKQKKNRVEYGKIGRMLLPSIPEYQVRRSVSLLERLGFITTDDAGYYKQAYPILSTGDEVSSVQIANYQIDTMKMAIEALDRCASGSRDISTLTLNISAKGFEKIKAKTQEFRKELLETAKNDQHEDRVYQCNFQIFPLTREYLIDE
jgi:uncharacterized protein (TIGR02147 family)